MGSTGEEVWSLFQVFEAGNRSFLARFILGLVQNEQHFFRAGFNPIEKTKQVELAVPGLIPRQPNEA
jgi:hypothetical protein